MSSTFTDRVMFVSSELDTHINFEVEWEFESSDEIGILKVTQYDDDWVVSKLVYDANPDSTTYNLTDEQFDWIVQDIQSIADTIPQQRRLGSWERSRHK